MSANCKSANFQDNGGNVYSLKSALLPLYEEKVSRGLFRDSKSRVPLKLYPNFMGSKHQF